MSFPFDLHSAAVSDSHLPCRAHAIPDHAILLKATAQHGRQERACGLSARVRLLPAITQSSFEVVIRRVPISNAGGQCETKHRLSWTRKRVVATHYKKETICYAVGLAVIYFWLPCGHSQRTRHCQSRAGARHSMCELTHGIGTACYV